MWDQYTISFSIFNGRCKVSFFFKLFINRKCSCMNFDWIWMISYQKGISKIDNDYYSVSSKMYDLNHEEFQKRWADPEIVEAIKRVVMKYYCLEACYLFLIITYYVTINNLKHLITYILLYPNFQINSISNFISREFPINL